MALAPLAVLVLLVAGVFALPSIDLRSDLGYEMMNLGESLARDGTFSNPLAAAPTGPTATEPPLYPLFLALCMKIFRDVQPVLLAVTLAGFFAGAATAVLLHSLVRRLLGSAAAIFAAVLWLASSWMGNSGNWIFWDAAFTPAVLLGFAHATVDRAEPHAILRCCVLPGTLLGALFLLNPAALVLAAAWWICRALAWNRDARIPLRPILGSFLGMLIVAGIVGAPWIVRNYALWGRFIVRENFGYTFYTSNNPCAVPHLAQNLGNKCYSETHPNENAAEAHRMQALGEPAYDRIQTAAAMAWIRANPQRFANLTLSRIRLFWFPLPFEFPFQSYATWAITLISIPGLIWMVRNRTWLAAFVASAALLYPAVYYVVVADIRYRAPFSWAAVIPAAYLCARIYERIGRRRP